MGFAADWLTRRALFPEFIKEPPDDQTGIIVVIPAFDEPSVSPVLDSLNSCSAPDCKAEVIIVVNAPENASPDSLGNNNKCIKNIINWKKTNSSFFRLYVFDAGQAPVKKWGVGLARKTGMDEALRRFSFIDRPDGVIVCLDADCRVEKNYFTAISGELLFKKGRNACSIYFEHPLSGIEFPESIYRYIIQYELHLRYFVDGLIYAGYPNALHAVGSALAVKADQYMKAGGMNRRQAGEDFYFVQKLLPLGGFFSLISTTVYPSPRESFRVPFGTGAMIAKLLGEGSNRLLTYNISAFSELKELFKTGPELFSAGKGVKANHYDDLPNGIRSFVDRQEWSEKIAEIRKNTSSEESFRKRFFSWFNAFRIVKYMNHVHNGIFEKQEVSKSACDLLKAMAIGYHSEDAEELLILLRGLDRQSG
ncbi:MAG: glycosyltransferase family A protein [Bacteroidota bacterium]